MSRAPAVALDASQCSRRPNDSAALHLQGAAIADGRLGRPFCGTVRVDKRALLDELKIDRGAAVASPAAAAIALVRRHRGRRRHRVRRLVRQFPEGGAGDGGARRSLRRRSRPKSAQDDSVLDATGYVVARRQATVSAKVTGKVVEVFIEEGMRVKEGQVLARLDDSIPRAELALSESQLAAATSGSRRNESADPPGRARSAAHRKVLRRASSRAHADLDRAAVDARRSCRRGSNAARQDVVVAERSAAVQRQLLDDMEIRAPFTGVVVAKAAQPGEMISPNSAGGGFTRTGICTIVDMDSLEVEVDVNEAYINRVQPKQPVAVALNAYPDERIPAEVIAIIPTADRNKATVRVRIALLEKNPRVLPDMGVKVAFLDENGRSPPTLNSATERIKE